MHSLKPSAGNKLSMVTRRGLPEREIVLYSQVRLIPVLRESAANPCDHVQGIQECRAVLMHKCYVL
jgi:hypothetical protein